jgi:hypothetical protein
VRFRQAESRFRSLTESPTARRSPERWDRAEARFRAIVDASPSGPWADDASYLLAEVCHERFHTFHREGDLDRAIEQYERLVDGYPRSPHADDALVQLGEIHYYQLGDPDQALRLYRRVLRDYPAGDMAARARARATAIERRAPTRATVDAHEATLGDHPAPPRPLSSPGAVIGGRLLTGRPAGGPARSEGRDGLIRSEGRDGLTRSEGRDGLTRSEDGIPTGGDGRSEGRQGPVSRVRAERLPESLEPEGPEQSGAPEPPGAAPTPLETGSGAAGPRPSRPLNPLLEEGPIPLRTPADNLPVLAPQGPRSQVGFSSKDS